MSTTVSPIRARGEGGMSLLCNTRACWLHAGVPRGIVSGFRALTHSRVSQSRREYMQWEWERGGRSSRVSSNNSWRPLVLLFVFRNRQMLWNTLRPLRNCPFGWKLLLFGFNPFGWLPPDCRQVTARVRLPERFTTERGGPCRVWLLTRKWELLSLAYPRGTCSCCCTPPPEPILLKIQ